MKSNITPEPIIKFETELFKKVNKPFSFSSDSEEIKYLLPDEIVSINAALEMVDNYKLMVEAKLRHAKSRWVASGTK